jgi:hypothetical protein
MAAPPPAIPNKPGKVQVQVVRSLFDYTAARDDELSFQEGDIIFLLLKQGEWYKARCGDKEGLIPANYGAFLGHPPVCLFELSSPMHWSGRGPLYSDEKWPERVDARGSARAFADTSVASFFRFSPQ